MMVVSFSSLPGNVDPRCDTWVHSKSIEKFQGTSFSLEDIEKLEAVPGNVLLLKQGLNKHQEGE